LDCAIPSSVAKASAFAEASAVAKAMADEMKDVLALWRRLSEYDAHFLFNVTPTPPGHFIPY
jgi:muconolactone delta-isomerase